MDRRGIVAAAVMALAVLPAAGRAVAAEKCTLGKIGELPVTMRGTAPLVSVGINGEQTPFIADSGAFYSSLTPAAAAQHHLKLEAAPPFMRVMGVGGEMRISVAEVKSFGLSGAEIPNVEFLVGGSEVGAGAAGLIGQNVLHVGDVEYDLSGGMIRLFKPQGCDNAALAYWADGKPISKIDMFQPDGRNLQTLSYAKVNGRRIRVMFDTGANNSVMSLGAARRAGIRTDGPGVAAAGYSGGVGRGRVPTWVAPVDSFEIGDEQIKHTRLRIGDIGIDKADMLLGADFFLSHRVYVSNRYQEIFFTYGGGPVFNLTHVGGGPPGAQAAQPPAEGAAPQTPSPAATAPTTTAAAAAPIPGAPSSEPTDAEGYSRRGSAFAARRDYEHAIADFTRAMELDPMEARYPRERAQARIGLRQLFLAMADLDTVLKLEPHDLDALVLRAELKLAGRDIAGERADLDAAAAAAAKEADLRLRLAQMYLGLDQFDAALAQYDLWIAVHADDNRYFQALSGRCRTRVLANVDLDKAQRDCDQSIRITKAAGNLETRGLLEVRRGDSDHAIADFDEVLKHQPKDGWALWGRAVAEAHKALKAESETDAAAATTAAPALPAHAKRLGFAP